MTLGRLGIEGNDFGRTKPLLVLAYLTLEGPQNRGHLAELFWPGSSGARRSLTTTIGRLRNATPGVEANEQRAWSELPCDALEFERALGEGDLEYALGLYRGPFLDGVHLPDWSVEVEEWVYTRREYLADSLRNALLRRAMTEAVRGRFDLAASWAERAWQVAGASAPDPDTLLRLHDLSRADDRPLAKEIAAEAEVYGLVTSESAGAARASLEDLGFTRTPHNLPSRGGPFIGREVELADLARALTKPELRLLTLVGPGGTGKTRLSLQAARDALDADAFTGGVYFVALEADHEVGTAAATVAASLGANVQSDPLAEVTRLIGNKQMLLVLDNFEQLEGGASLAALLLERCENLKLLVTTRERLELSSEWVLVVKGMAFPHSVLATDEARTFDAVRLFVHRASQVNPGFEPDEDELRHVLRLCQLLEGAPLGLELAAAWTHILSTREIADEVESTYDFLARRSSGENQRHRSLRTVFTHSWAMLSDDERKTLRRLTLFRGGFALSAAKAIAGASAKNILSLVDKSLVSSTQNGRFQLHEVTRQYAEEKLAEDEGDSREVMRQYVAYFRALAEEAESQLKSAGQAEWLARIELERDNLRYALDCCLEEGWAEAGLGTVSALQQFWWSRGPYSEGYDRTMKLLELDEAEEVPRLRAKALHRAGTLVMELGDFERSGELYERAADLAREQGDEQLLADALHSLGLLASKQRAGTEAAEYYRQCLELQRKLGDTWGLAVTLNNMAVNMIYVGDYLSARPLLLESLELKTRLGETQGIAYALQNLGTVALQLGEFTETEQYLERSLELKQEIGDSQGIASSLANLGRLAMKRQRRDEARSLMRRSLVELTELPNPWALAWVLTAVVALEAQAGEPELALRLAGAVDGICEESKISLPAANAQELEAGRVSAAKSVGSRRAAEILAEGRGTPLDRLLESLAKPESRTVRS